MESDILKHFVNHEVEILIGGVWVEGLLLPIAKGIVVLKPIGEMATFYGPCSFKSEDIMAIRQLKKQSVPLVDINPPKPPVINSGFDPISPHYRFLKKQG